MEELEERLDRLCLELLEILSEIDLKKRTQENQLKDGYLYLAKARYAIGVDRVSKLHYAAIMKPRLTVQYNKDSTGKFAVVPSHQPSENSERLGDAVLRKRTVPHNTKHSDGEIGSEEDAPEKSQNTSKERQFVEDVDKPKIDFDDPIRWFGVLVPQTLRFAQSSFTQAIHTSCELCSLQLKLEKTRSEYREARKLQALYDKNILQGATADNSEENCEEPDQR